MEQETFIQILTFKSKAPGTMRNLNLNNNTSIALNNQSEVVIGILLSHEIDTLSTDSCDDDSGLILCVKIYK